MKSLLAKVLLVLYSAILIWLVLFKFSIHIQSVLHYDKRSVNLIPFSSSSGSSGEMVDNVLVFIPFGLLLGINFKRADLWRKLIVVLAVSVSFEVIQYIFAIGSSDITDVITNTLGGLIGLSAYALGERYFDEDRLDRYIVVVGSALLVVAVVFLVVVEVHHGVRYHSPKGGQAMGWLGIGPLGPRRPRLVRGWSPRPSRPPGTPAARSHPRGSRDRETRLKLR